MPGKPLGAIAPALSLASNEPTRATRRGEVILASNEPTRATKSGEVTRTRRNHGVMTLGGQMAAIYSSRRTAACYGVRFEIGAGTLTLASDMTPAQARTLARALTSAADAVESVAKGDVR